MPYRPTERQYRNFAASNFKPITRDADDASPSYKVRGYFTTFNDEYCLYERSKYWPAEYEQIDRHALDNADLSDVIMQYDHCGPVMARNKNGSMIIGTDEHGAWCEADLSGCQQARDLYEAISNGLVTEMSFAFALPFDDDGEGYTSFKDENGDWHTTITRISKVYDTSAVSIPANPSTDISEMRKRSYLAARIEADRKAEEAAAEQATAEQVAVEEPEQRTADTTALRKRKALALEMRAIELGY